MKRRIQEVAIELARIMIEWDRGFLCHEECVQLNNIIGIHLHIQLVEIIANFLMIIPSQQQTQLNVTCSSRILFIYH